VVLFFSSRAGFEREGRLGGIDAEGREGELATNGIG